MNRVGVRLVAIWMGLGFLTNFAWEMLHMRLFAGAPESWQRCASAAAVDVALLAFLYAVMAAAGGSLLWFREAALPRAIALAAIGALVAVAIELRALADGRWSYSHSMPVVPFFDVGWSPVLQMVVIPLGLSWLSSKATRMAP